MNQTQLDTEADLAKEKTYRIGDACSRVDIQPYVLRYWETEFPPLSPDKSQSGQRLYTEQDIQVIQRIKELLYDEGYTIAGAKKKLESELESGGPQTARSPGDGGAESEPASDSEPATAKKTKKAAKKSSRKRTVSRKKDGTAERDESEDLVALREGIENVLSQARSLLEELES